MNKPPNKQTPNSNNPATDPNNMKWIVLIGLSIVAGILFFVILPSLASTRDQIPLTDLAAQIKAGQVDKIIIRNDVEVIIQYKNGKVAATTKEGTGFLGEQLAALGVTPAQYSAVQTTNEASNQVGGLLSFIQFTVFPIMTMIFIALFPILLIGLFLRRLLKRQI